MELLPTPASLFITVSEEHKNGSGVEVETGVETCVETGVAVFKVGVFVAGGLLGILGAALVQV